MKILVVDDESIVRRAIVRALEKKGHEVFEAENGKIGYDLWKSNQPDLMFLDVLMPELSGPEVLKKMGTQKFTKVVLMSAYSGEYNVEKAKGIGADVFVAKPFDNIFTVVEQAIGLVE
ncbi:MAG: response regulator [Bdellovibrionales bacterium]|nr:response regulator [Bdellovibrionales bacterium]